ncbi:hypothetical protein vseg_004567 [Gypsophila vaccaria]
MGKGRSPCCDKAGVKKGAWSEAEDLKLISFIQVHGHSNWRALPKLAGLARCGKSCRLRWVNYLRPDLRRGNFTLHEEEAIIRLHKELGNKWSKIAAKFPGRTDNEIKNVWNTHLKKRIKDEEPNKQSQDSCDILLASATTDEALVENAEDDRSEQKLVHPTDSMDDTIEHSSSSSTSHIISSQPPFPGHKTENLDPESDYPGAPSSDMTKSTSEKNVSSMIIDEGIKNDPLEELTEMSFDSNLDLWDLLDGDQSDAADVTDVLLSDIDIPLQLATQNDNISSDDMSYTEGNANRWWLVYLENELGLDQTESTSSQ